MTGTTVAKKKKAPNQVLSRSKACKSCASMKRRCDMLFPSCSRCAKRGTPCVYSGATSNPMVIYMNELMGSDGSSSSNSPKSDDALVSRQASFYSQHNPSCLTPPIQADPMADVDAFVRSATTNGIEISEDYGPGILNSTYTNHLWGLNDFETIQPHPSKCPLAPVMAVTRNYDSANAGFRHFAFSDRFCDTTIPKVVNDSREMPQHEIDFYITRMQQYPRIFSRTLLAPFIHQLLYSDDLPTPLRIAHTICSLNETKTSTNERIINTTSRELIDTLLRISPRSIRDTLALAQAILLVQCVRLFGGNPTESASAEKLNPKLLSLLDDLIDHYQSHSHENEAFKSWIFLQSICRTVGVAYFTLCLYHALRLYSNIHLTTDLPMTMPVPVWNAKSEPRWNAAKSQFGGLSATYIKTAEALSNVNPSMLCFEGLLLIAVHIGVDAVESKYNIVMTEHPEFINYLH